MIFVPVRGVPAGDDVLHPPDDAGGWSEHHYFFFSDARTGLAGGCRVAWRVEEGATQGVAFCYTPHGVCIWQHREGGERLRAGPLRFEGERLGTWRIAFEADVLGLPDPLALSGLRELDREARTVRVGWDLTFAPMSPAVEGDPGPADRAFVSEIAPRRFEQSGRFAGTLHIDGDRHAIDGFGTRDHSWGIRRAEGLREWKWCTMPLGEDLSAGAGHVRFDRGEITSGWLATRGELIAVTGSTVVFEPDETGIVPGRVAVTLETAVGRRRFDGTVVSPMGLRVTEHGTSILALECLTRYAADDGRNGWGVAEYVRAL
jgi:hypothetical protein